MKIDLTDRVALVTGAATGIGQATADRLADNGAHVFYTDINEEGANASAAECPSGRATAMGLDITNREQIETVINRIVADRGKLDILIHNAGVNTMKHRVNIDQFPADEWERIINTDLTGVYNVSHAALKPMIHQGGGRIVNIASVMGVIGARLQCAFVAAKAGIVNLTRAMAIELAPQGILVNCVAPGSTLTDGTKKLFYSEDSLMRERTERMLSHVPLGRPGTVDEIAQGILFFVDPDNSYTTGHTLCVDGGWTAGGFARDF